MPAVIEPKSSPIAGVSAGIEAEIMTAYPSIAATATGERIGRLCDRVPVRTNGVAWPRLLIAIPLWFIVVPIALTIALPLYFFMKIFGRRYVLTNRALYVRPMIGIRTFAQSNLNDIREVVIQATPGQSYYKAGDILARGADGKTLIRLDGVPHAAVFRQTILEARDARRSVEESLKTIEARKAL